MGLLDIDFSDPQQMGLLSAGAAGLQASGPSLMPHSLGQILGQSLGGYMQGAQGAQKQQMAAEQLKMLKLQEQRAQNLFDMQKQAFNDVGGPAQAAAPAMPGQLGSGMFGTVAPPSGMPAIPQQQAPSGNGDAELRKLKQYAILGVPGAKELFDIYKYQTDGVKRDPNSIIDHPGGGREFIPDIKSGIGGYDFTTNTMIPVNGYADFQAGLEGKKTAATEAEKARYGVTTLNLKGGPRAVSTAQLPSIFGVDGSTSAPPTTQPAAASPLQAHADYLSTISDPQERQSFIKAVENKIAFTPAAQRQALAKQWGSMVAGQGAPAQAPASTGPGLELQDDASKEQELGDIRLKQGTQGKINDNWISTSYNPALQAGKDAQSMHANLDALSNIDIKTGWNTEAKANAANMLVGLGIAPDNAKLFAANAQKFQSIAGERLWNTLNSAKGPQTEGDASRAKQVFAQLQNTPEANAFILDFARAKANMDARRAQYYEEALPLAQAEGDLSKVDREWRKIQGSIWADPVLQKYNTRGK